MSDIEKAADMLHDYANALRNGDLDGAGHSLPADIQEVILWMDEQQADSGEAVAWLWVKGGLRSAVAKDFADELIEDGEIVQPLYTHSSASVPDDFFSEMDTLVDLLRDAAMAEGKVDTCYNEPNKNPRLAAALNWLAEWLPTNLKRPNPPADQESK